MSKVILKVYIDYPGGGVTEEVEVSSEASMEEIEGTAEAVFMNSCSYGFELAVDYE